MTNQIIAPTRRAARTKSITSKGEASTLTKSNVVQLRVVGSEQEQKHDLCMSILDLYRLASDGKLKGMAFGAEMQGGKFITNVLGSCNERPTFALGMVSYLGDLVRSLQHDGNEAVLDG